MPWVEVEEGHQEVDAYCRRQRHDEVGEYVVADIDVV